LVRASSMTSTLRGAVRKALLWSFMVSPVCEMAKDVA
jgi:hypothetical protein